MSVQTAAQVFPVDALEANRLGRLTDVQRQNLGRMARADRKNEFTGSFVFAALGLLILFGADSSKPPLLHYGFPALCLLAVVFFLYRSTSAGDALTRDLRGGSVQTVEGAITRWAVNNDSGTSSSSSYYMEVDHRRFPLSYAAYEAVPEAGIVRVYYLPQSKHVVNFEQLPDRPLPAGAIESPMTIAASALAGMRSGDRTTSAEARAQLKALGDAEKALFTPAAATPPPASSDARPLADAIVGTWQLGPMKVRFGNDGVAALQMPNGQTRQGHWSVDAGGKLHLDALDGKDQATQAWVVGDELTVTMEGQGITAHRVAG